MGSTVKSAVLSGILLFCFGRAAYAADPWQDLLKGLEQKGKKDTESGRPQSSPGGGIDLGVVRALTGFSQEEEVAIGRQAAGNILGAAPLVKDAKLQQYVNRVGRWIASQSERPDLDWHFGVIESNDLNAFAAPGGYIFVTKGLYRSLQSESELAGVLAHEVGHVIKKHHLKILQQSRLWTWVARSLPNGWVKTSISRA